MNAPIFMDYHSTTRVDPRVADKVVQFMLEDFGNASSVDHCFGDTASAAVEDARKQVSSLVGASSGKVVFTSGATESINLVLLDFLRRSPNSKIALLPLEHSAVLETCTELADDSDLLFLEVDRLGRLDMESLSQALEAGVGLVCIMAANNEIGNIYPVAEIGRLCAEYSVPFLCDASQAAGKIPIEFDSWKITYLVLSSHKMYGPKGVGALVANRSTLPRPIIFGGEQEFGVRPGTINVPAVVGFGHACHLRAVEMTADEVEIAARRDRLEHLLCEEIPGIVVNGDLHSRLAGNLHVSISGAQNDAVITRIRQKLAISRGAACSSGIERPSHVLKALGLPEELVEGSFRFGLGKFTTDDEVVEAARTFIKAVSDVQSAINTSARRPVKVHGHQ